jgi:hypothetical protein
LGVILLDFRNYQSSTRTNGQQVDINHTVLKRIHRCNKYFKLIFVELVLHILPIKFHIYSEQIISNSRLQRAKLKHFLYNSGFFDNFKN